MPTAICNSRSGARGGGPAVPTGIWTARMRRWVKGEEVGGGGGGGEQLIKSNNPQLAGGEKTAR